MTRSSIELPWTKRCNPFPMQSDLVIPRLCQSWNLLCFWRFCSRKTDNCQVDTVSRTNCKKCRLKKCLAIGMKPEKVGWSNYNVHDYYKGRHQWKNNVFFRALPESPKPPPWPQFGQLGPFFFGRQNSRFESPKKKVCKNVGRGGRYINNLKNS